MAIQPNEQVDMLDMNAARLAYEVLDMDAAFRRQVNEIDQCLHCGEEEARHYFVAGWWAAKETSSWTWRSGQLRT